MLTEFGKFMRILRIQHGEEAKDMSKKLGFSPSYLSSIENGKRNIPTNIEALLLQSYSLSDREKEKLHKAIIDSSSSIKIELSDFDENKKKLMLTMAQEDIDDKTIEKIYSIVKKGSHNYMSEATQFKYHDFSKKLNEYDCEIIYKGLFAEAHYGEDRR